MKNIMMAIRSLTKRGRHNEMKIISLALGLAVGFVLISRFLSRYGTRLSSL